MKLSQPAFPFLDKKVLKYLNDFLLAIENIDLHLQRRRGFSELERNLTNRRAVEREIGIIGEAVTKILKIDPQINISSSRKIIATWNIVVHAYDAVDEIVLRGDCYETFTKTEI